MNHAQEYVRKVSSMMSGAQKEYWKWLLAHGECFVFTPLEDYELHEELKKRIGKSLFKPRACYYNAQICSVWDASKPFFLYYEGFATTDDFDNLPFEHGFLVHEGKVLDPTWKNGRDYFGVQIPVDFVRKEIVKTGVAGSILFRYYYAETHKEEKSVA